MLQLIKRSTINTVPIKQEIYLPVRVYSININYRYVCDVCHLSFSKMYNLNKHIYGKHQQDVKRECGKCRKSFSCWDNLRQHQAICQTIHFKFPCCHKILLESVIKYMGLHSVPSCDTCQEQFVVLDNLQVYRTKAQHTRKDPSNPASVGKNMKQRRLPFLQLLTLIWHQNDFSSDWKRKQHS